MEYIVRLPSALKQILLQSGAVRWAQLALLRIFFNQDRDRSFESGKSLSKSHGNSLGLLLTNSTAAGVPEQVRVDGEEVRCRTGVRAGASREARTASSWCLVLRAGR